MLDLAARGVITPLVYKVFPLEQAREAMDDDGAPRALRQDRPQARSGDVKRLGVDVGGTFTDLIYVDDEAGTILVHKLPTTPEDPSEGTVQGIRELDRARRARRRRARPGLPRHDDRDEHRDRAQRRHASA